MSKDVYLRKGLNIRLKGEAEQVYSNEINNSNLFEVNPTDFHLLTPKLIVKVGDLVKSGSPLFFDKYNEKIKFCSPVSGEIKEIVRGPKRKILKLIINSDNNEDFIDLNINSEKKYNRQEIIDIMCKSGIWPFIRQRPYDVIANPNDIPKAIFISCFNSAPNATDNDFILHGKEELFQYGLDLITSLTDGITHLNIDGYSNPPKALTEAKGVQKNNIYGPHPSGNVGIQIHHIDPINTGEIVWYLYPQDILSIANVFKNNKYDLSKIVAVTGSQIKRPKYHKINFGARVEKLLNDNMKNGKSRIISGNVLTGSQISLNDSIGFYDDQVSAIPEGDDQKFLGWILPGFNKFSMSRTFFSWLMPNLKYELNANKNGEERAYVVTGDYEKVLPMNIFPLQLIKAIMVEDIELMENLGIYEVSPEDFALCEFICTSKVEVQSIIRKGLDLIRKENS